MGFELGDRELVGLDDPPARQPDGERRGPDSTPPDADVLRVGTEIRRPAGTDPGPPGRIVSLDPAPDQQRNQNQKPPCLNVHLSISVAVGGRLERRRVG